MRLNPLLILLPLLALSLPAQAITTGDKAPKAAVGAQKTAGKKSAPHAARARAVEWFQSVGRLERPHAARARAVPAPAAEEVDVEQTVPAPTTESVAIEMEELPNGLRMSRFEITQSQWLAVMGSNPSHFASCGDDCPVENVSWKDVQGFIERLNRQSGQTYRLPSEDEWHEACLAGDKSTKFCGSNIINAVAWYDANAGDSTHPVGQKQPNAWGLYDMSGNVEEWTDSCFEDNCVSRIFRGGSWSNGPAFLSTASSIKGSTTLKNAYLGFRLLQDP